MEEERVLRQTSIDSLNQPSMPQGIQGIRKVENHEPCGHPSSWIKHAAIFSKSVMNMATMTMD